MELDIILKMRLSHAPLLIRKTLWVFCLAVALVFVQGVRLHVHVYGHDLVMSDHGHQEQAHFHHEALGTKHPGEVVEVDLSQQVLLKSLSLGSLVVALFAAVIVILSSRLLSRVPWPPERHGSLAAWLFRLRPPLRAPPL